MVPAVWEETRVISLGLKGHQPKVDGRDCTRNQVCSQPLVADTSLALESDRPTSGLDSEEEAD